MFIRVLICDAGFVISFCITRRKNSYCSAFLHRRFKTGMPYLQHADKFHQSFAGMAYLIKTFAIIHKSAFTILKFSSSSAATATLKLPSTTIVTIRSVGALLLLLPATKTVEVVHKAYHVKTLQYLRVSINN